MKPSDIILTELFSRVKLKYNPNTIQKEGWYLKKSWTEEEQKSFTQWLSDYLQSHADARKQIMARPSKLKKDCDRVASSFVFNYGWKLK